MNNSNIPNNPSFLASIGLAGGTGVIIVNATHPIDVIKTRMQIRKGTSGFSINQMIKSEGFFSLFRGLPVTWLREASYTSIKLGAYGPIRDAICNKDGPTPFHLKFISGSLSGGIGSCFGNPFDVIKTIQMAGEKKSISEIVKQMLEKQGVYGFSRGLQANITRGIVLNGTKMACYDEAKNFVTKSTGFDRNDIRCQFFSAGIAGFFMACTVTPIDMIKTRLMNQPINVTHYNGLIDCFTKVLKQEGPFAFYRGFLPIWGRFAPQATLQLVVFEQLLKFTGYSPI